MKKYFLILSMVAILVCGVLLLSVLAFGDGQAYLDGLLEKGPVSVKLWSSGEAIVLGEERAAEFLKIMEQVAVSPASGSAINKEGAVPASVTFVYEDGTSAKIGIPLFRTDRGTYRCNLFGMPILNNKTFLEFFTPEPGADEMLIAAARELLGEQIDKETPIDVLGFSSKDKWYIYWFGIGDEADCTYVTIEFAETKSGQLHPVGLHKPIDRGGDVASICWFDGYSFLVDSDKCKMIELVTNAGTELITVDTIPFVYYVDCIPNSYRFLDNTMKEL